MEETAALKFSQKKLLFRKSINTYRKKSGRHSIFNDFVFQGGEADIAALSTSTFGGKKNKKVYLAFFLNYNSHL